MARITVEDCLEQEPNRFNLVRLAAVRAKQLLSGSGAVVDSTSNREIVTALREIADGKVKFRNKPRTVWDEVPSSSDERMSPVSGNA
ncbi:MAG: DNA-directed RNA polymerase subunit omega [Deltaproteobacteria bacterium]|nr:DNA-directed RNA polymerase subunit omega [Deltaproteobacteria bacterium]